MELSQEFWLQLTIQILFLAFFAGVVWTKLDYIEEKQDKHNKLIERMYNVEKQTEKAHDRIDDIEEDIEEEFEEAS